MDSGASNDLQQATRDAYVAIAHYGMDKEVGYININGVSQTPLIPLVLSEIYPLKAVFITINAIRPIRMGMPENTSQSTLTISASRK